ncbi:MAG: TonB-dependent receptor plug domain-containing protein [Ignavibacteria bacterium]|nr:TonB-dependent receptor plug domain-containing protein [Ignavibacteria bacterium]
MNGKAGFFVKNKGLGMYNQIYYNKFGDNNLGFFKDGIQLNNNIFGFFDEELISINEVDRIELISDISSFIYGINTHGKSINIITKDIFSSKPFSQLRYSQDRYGSLFADASFTIPFSKKFNFLIRANNHSLDGKYTNSDFSAWRANGRISWYPSSLWNFKLDFNYSKISRGINDGLDYYTKDLSKDSIINILRDAKAPVIDSLGREENRNYNVSLSAFSNKFGANSLLTSQFYYTHYYRSFSGKPYAIPTPVLRINENYYSEVLGLNLKYAKEIIFEDKQSLNLTFLNNYYWNFYDVFYEPDDTNITNKKMNNSFGFFSAKANYKYDRFSISAMAKEDFVFSDSQNKNAFSYGGELKFNFITDNNFSLGIFTGINQINYLNVYYFSFDYPIFQKYSYHSFESGIEMNSKNLCALLSFNRTADLSTAKFNFKSVVSKFAIDSETEFKVDNFSGTLPYFSKNDVSFSDKFFKDKLNLKIGVNFKFISNFKGNIVYPQTPFTSTYADQYNFYSMNTKFISDFYIGARIGHANVNFTVANIFNSFYFDTFMFPSDDRGGLGGAVSRFTIVWDFIN